MSLFWHHLGLAQSAVLLIDTLLCMVEACEPQLVIDGENIQ